MHCDGVFLPAAQKLKIVLKGFPHEAIIRNGAIIYNGFKFSSPSGAGKEASQTFLCESVT